MERTFIEGPRVCSPQGGPLVIVLSIGLEWSSIEDTGRLLFINI